VLPKLPELIAQFLPPQWTPAGGTPPARCDVCARAKKGRCGTSTAPYKCRRRLAAGLPTSPPGRRGGSDSEGGSPPRGGSAGPGACPKP